MEKLKTIKAKVTSSKWKDGNELGKVIDLPENLKRDFVKYGYGEIVKESPEKIETPEKKRGRPKKTK